MRALGVDAAGSKGWVGVAIDDAGFVSAHLAPTVADLIEQAEAGDAVPGVGPVRLDAIGIDIPIGLVDGPVRSADVACRGAVGPRRSSVFPAPHPSVLGLDDLTSVNEVLHGLGHPGMSMQGFRLFPRIREVAALASDPRVIEVFPELSFRAMAEADLAWTKKSWNGAAQRRSLLAAATPEIVLPDDLGPAGSVPVDDVLDAAAAAWSAWRFAYGLGRPWGDAADVDPVTGRRIAVWS